MKKFFLFCVLALLAAAAWATPANMAILDGRPIEYDSNDLRGIFVGTPSWGADGTLSNLYVTWDSDYVYIALQAWQANNNKLVVLLDVDPGHGTGATTTTNWINRGAGYEYIEYNDYGWIDAGGFGLDYMLASEGTYNNVIRINYDGTELPTTNNTEKLFDQGNVSNPTLQPIDMVCLNDATACPHKGFEVRIPWTNLFAGTRFGTVLPGEKVPRGATLSLLAGIHNKTQNAIFSSPDTIPNQGVLDYTNAILTTADYLGVVVDADTNGIPDMLGGDVNAPWIRAASGAVGGTNLYVAFSESVTEATVENTANWTVGGVAPSTAVAQNSHIVLLGLAAPIASTNLLLLRATGVQDAALNSRLVEHCLFPAASGIPQDVTVTFQVNTNSGMGISAAHAHPNAFFVNGSSLPLEWGYSGYPPFETTAFTPIPGSNGWVSASVTFLAGSPSLLDYKYSARISGTNNYEAIRFIDFEKVARKLVLSSNGAPMTVREYLGAAAYPLRNPGNTNILARNLLYQDAQRGDAGMRVRREILFQLDLSLRKRNNLARVMVMGSDPLRGFNDTGAVADPKASDYPGGLVAWNEAGVQLFDDGTHGDTTADDGIFARLWAFSTNGFDSVIEPGDPYSLVGGVASAFFPVTIIGTAPYDGTGWLTLRSPRSVIYKFYAVTDTGTHYESPANNIEYYVSDPDETAQIVPDPFLWTDGNEPFLPLPPASNAPALTGVTTASTTATVQFENLLTEGAHGVKISTNLINGFDDYGLRATRNSTNGGLAQWSASIPEISSIKEYYAPYAGLEPAPTPTYWEPNINIPIGATTVRVFFCQFQSNLRGMRSMTLTGNFRNPVWDNGQPMTFLSNGIWMTDVALPAGTDGSGVQFKPRGGPAHDWYTTGGDFQFVRGTGGVTWAPAPPVPGQPLTLTLDVAGTPLAAATNVHLHMGFDNWKNVQSPRPAMTNTSGTIWEYAFEVSTNYSLSVDWVFTTLPVGDTGTWYNSGNWHAFMAPYFNAP